jgi:hypothetical protein
MPAIILPPIWEGKIRRHLKHRLSANHCFDGTCDHEHADNYFDLLLPVVRRWCPPADMLAGLRYAHNQIVRMDCSEITESLKLIELYCDSK